jgi:hypothetical protein
MLNWSKEIEKGPTLVAGSHMFGELGDVFRLKVGDWLLPTLMVPATYSTTNRVPAGIVVAGPVTKALQVPASRVPLNCRVNGVLVASSPFTFTSGVPASDTLGMLPMFTVGVLPTLTVGVFATLTVGVFVTLTFGVPEMPRLPVTGKGSGLTI